MPEQTAVITGASQGIGREIARVLADDGYNLALAARSDGIYETAERIGSATATLPVETDVTDEVQVKAAVDQTVEEFGGIDCLVNNAGIAGPTAGIENIDVDAWRNTMAVNVDGMFLMTKHTVDHLRRSERGSIVNISSISGKRPLENRTPYTASKMAVIGLTRTLAFELGSDNITVNAICPGATRGPRIENVIQAQAESMGVDYDTAKEEVFTGDTALGTLVEDTDIAHMVRYLASDNGRHITAQDLNVDAGTTWY
jgi:NAD(P)-dependent dehydrogenase (short-subunit alcohol dehydrogenase family)